MRSTAFFLALLLPLQAPPAKPPSGDIRREVSVGRIVVEAFVTDGKGDPILGLSPSEFRATLDGIPTAVESAEWIPAAPPGVVANPSDPAIPSGGRLIVFFFQTDFTRSRLVGQLRMSQYARRYLDTLLPTDRVALLSFDSHLKLRLDFTGDRERIRAALSSSLKIDDPVSGSKREDSGPALSPNLSSQDARQAATVDRALELTALALAPLPGPKALIYFGWGLNIDRTPSGGDELSRAVNALLESHVPFFTLDVSDSDSHTLETGLQQLSAFTGGTYAKTNLFPGQAMDRVRRTLLGRYELVLVPPEGRPLARKLEVTLVGRKGNVFARATTTGGNGS